MTINYRVKEGEVITKGELVYIDENDEICSALDKFVIHAIKQDGTYILRKLTAKDMHLTVIFYDKYSEKYFIPPNFELDKVEIQEQGTKSGKLPEK